MSIFSNLKGVLSSYLSASFTISHYTHCPSCIVANAGAWFTVSEFTKFISVTLCQLLKERSIIVRYDCNLCGIMTNGEILSLQEFF